MTSTSEGGNEMKNDLTRNYAMTAHEASEKRLEGIMDWIVRDIVRLSERKDCSAKYKADELLSILGSSLMTDFRVEYGRYQALSEIKDTLMEVTE